jgi:energy-converting hydrogenase Eha subunit A
MLFIIYLRFTVDFFLSIIALVKKFNCSGGFVMTEYKPEAEAAALPVHKRKLGDTAKTLLFLAVFTALFCMFSIPMGLANALNTIMNTAYRLLIDTTLYIMALAVIAGALSALLTEYGVVELLNKILSPLMKPLYGMPGASALGIVTTYLSDNPAILTLAGDRKFRQYFKAYQIPALTNLGTAFGMGLIVTTFMLSLNVPNVGLAVLCGNLGTVAGSIVSTRLMLLHTAKEYGKDRARGHDRRERRSGKLRRTESKGLCPRPECPDVRRQKRRGYGPRHNSRRAGNLHAGDDAHQGSCGRRRLHRQGL